MDIATTLVSSGLLYICQVRLGLEAQISVVMLASVDVTNLACILPFWADWDNGRKARLVYFRFRRILIKVMMPIVVKSAKMLSYLL